jgi:hypothetical protein
VDTEPSQPKVIFVSGPQNRNVLAWSTMLFGNNITDLFLQASTCITETKTNLTTPSKIWNYFQNLVINGGTLGANSETGYGGNRVRNAETGILLTTTISDQMASVLGAVPVASEMQLRVSVEDATSTHPTVKPISLMSWLIKLVTPPEGIVCDPFTGSGSTGVAAILDGFNFIGVERENEYTCFAEARLKWAVEERLRATAQQELFPV